MKLHIKIICTIALLSGIIGATKNEKPLRRKYRRAPSKDSHQATWRLTAISNRIFAHQLFNNIARHKMDGNILISPFVISSGLSMTLLGARGKTADEIMTALGYAIIGDKRNGERYSQEDVPRLYKMMVKSMKTNNTTDGYSLIIANRLFGDQSETFLPAFIKGTEEYYGAPLQTVDFRGDAEGARRIINNWVQNRTETTIKEAVPPGAMSSATLLALVSTTYFKGTWKYKFNPDETTKRSFNNADGTISIVPFMRGKFPVRYTRSMDSHILILPYKNPGSKYTIQMELFLPFEQSGMRSLEQMSEESYHTALKGVPDEEVEVEIQLPRFEMEFGMDLAQILQRFNIRTLFNRADLSGMNGKYNLYVGSAIHKTFLKVNEEGTTASAAMMQLLHRASGQYELEFNQPFILIIREMHTNTVLFMGRVAQL